MAKIWKFTCLTVIVALVLSLGMVLTPAVQASADGTANGLLIDAASVSMPPPEITDVSPRCIEELNTCKDGNWITITGSGFDWGTTVTIGDSVSPESIDLVSETEIKFCIGSGSGLRHGTYDVTVTNSDTQSDTLPSALTYTETCKPVASFAATPTTGQAPLTCCFRDMSAGFITSWSWDFSASGSYRQNPCHTFQSEGTYRVCLTVTGPGGTSIACKDIIVESMALAPKLMVRNLEISTAYAQPRQEIQINARVVNDGGVWGSKTVNLIINGQSEQSLSVGVAPGTAKPISFTIYKVDAGEYQVDIGGATGTFYVVAEPQAPGGAAQPGAMGLDTGTMIIIIVIGFVLIAGIIVAIVVSRRP